MASDDEDKATEIVSVYLEERSIKRTVERTGATYHRVRSLAAPFARDSRPGPRMSPELREAADLAELYLDSTGSAPWYALASRAGVTAGYLRELIKRRR